MPEIKNYTFNTQPLLEEIDLVIKRGLTNVFKDFVARYESLENTHSQIINILSLNKNLNPEVEDDDSKYGVLIKEEEIDMYKGIEKMTKDIVCESVSNIEGKIENLEKKYDSIVPVLNKLLKAIEILGDDVKILQSSTPISEKENIKLEIEEEEEEEEEEEAEEEQEEEEQEEEAEEEEEEEEAEEQEEEEEEEEQEEEEEEEQEEEEELVEIEIDDVTYCTNNEENGFIYELSADGEQGDKVGYLKDGEPFFYADEK